MRPDLICLQIDLARQKERIDFVKSYADFAAECGYNTLILYLENASGRKIPVISIKKKRIRKRKSVRLFPMPNPKGWK